MQLRLQEIEYNVTSYPTMQLHIHTFREEQAIQNDVKTTAYHHVVTTLYPLLTDKWPSPVSGIIDCVLWYTPLEINKSF